MSMNGTRMTEHIRKCLKCPIEVKKKYGLLEKIKRQTAGVLDTMFPKKENKGKLFMRKWICLHSYININDFSRNAFNAKFEIYSGY